ncbi:hypothetical protein JP74_09190 [Devosia sp. 17-2-E-8]|nr:hypothetical protein JP74_09190 [Devosia sp. 17-2-E-8]
MAEICLSTKTWRSGAAWFNQQLVASLAEAGASVAYIAPLALPEDREPNQPNVERHIVPRELTDGPKLRRRIASLRRITTGLYLTLMQRWSTRTFILSIPEPLLFTLPLLILLRLSGARILLVVHDAKPHAWSLPIWLRSLEWLALWLLYRLATDLVCLTRATAEALTQHFSVRGQKLTIIPHGAFRLGPAAPLPGNGNLLAFGSIRRNKGIREVIEAVLKCRAAGRNLRLTIAGEVTDKAYWRECQSLVARRPEAFDLRLGFVPDEDVPNLLAKSDAVVLAYTDFASQSGVAVLAALAGRPVIATRSGGLDELFERGMAGETIACPIPDDIAAAFIRFYDRPIAEWSAHAEVARVRIESTLDWASIAGQYLRLIRQPTVSAIPADA